jgi:hypothetical protein
MPLFEIKEHELVPFRSIRGSSELYEAKIEDLLWNNLEDFTGEALFRIARQLTLPTGGRPDVVALDKSGRLVIFEIKRDVDRRQLAQCLEYAGWGRTTSLDDLAQAYHGGVEAFWRDWMQFTESETPMVVNPQPRLILVARDFQQRTESALEYLIESGVPIELIRVSLYVDQAGRQFMVVEGDHEPEPWATTASDRQNRRLTKVHGRQVRIDDLLEAGFLQAGDALLWERPQLGVRYEAVVHDDGSIRLSDGRVFSSPSRAAMEAAGSRAVDGWTAWTVVRLGEKLTDVRRRFVEHVDAPSGESID